MARDEWSNMQLSLSFFAVGHYICQAEIARTSASAGTLLALAQVGFGIINSCEAAKAAAEGFKTLKVK